MTRVYERMRRDYPREEYFGYVIPGVRKDGFVFEDELSAEHIGGHLVLHDLLTYGRLIDGEDVREQLPAPSKDELIEDSIPAEIKRRVRLGLTMPELSGEQRRRAYTPALPISAQDTLSSIINAARSRLLCTKGTWVPKGKTAVAYSCEFRDPFAQLVAEAVEARRCWSQSQHELDHGRTIEQYFDFLDFLWHAGAWGGTRPQPHTEYAPIPMVS